MVPSNVVRIKVPNFKRICLQNEFAAASSSLEATNLGGLNAFEPVAISCIPALILLLILVWYEIKLHGGPTYAILSLQTSVYCLQHVFTISCTPLFRYKQQAGNYHRNTLFGLWVLLWNQLKNARRRGLQLYTKCPPPGSSLSIQEKGDLLLFPLGERNHYSQFIRRVSFLREQHASTRRCGLGRRMELFSAHAHTDSDPLRLCAPARCLYQLCVTRRNRVDLIGISGVLLFLFLFAPMHPGTTTNMYYREILN